MKYVYLLAPVDLGFEEIVQQQIGQIGALGECLLNVAQEDTADNAAAAPHQGNSTVVEIPIELLCRLAQQHESLGVGNDLRAIKSILDVVQKLLLVGDR